MDYQKKIEHACNSAIFSESYLKNPNPEKFKGYINIFPGYTEIRHQTIFKQKQNSKNNNIKKRGKITNFSKKSRIRMIKYMNRWINTPNLWVDHTFVDDTMVNKAIDERAVYSSAVFKRYKENVERKYSGIEFIERREWEERKSGKLKGELVPHFHGLYYIPPKYKIDPTVIAIELQLLWVNATRTNKKNIALKVALHRKSYRKITSVKMANVYVSKYVAKVEKHKLDDSISLGRFWMTGGNPQVSDGDTIYMNNDENVMIRRFLRRYVKKKFQRLRRQISQGVETFVLISDKTILRLYEYIQEELSKLNRNIKPIKPNYYAFE